MNWTVKQQVNFYTQEFRPSVLPEEIIRLQWHLGLNVLGLVLVGFLLWAWLGVAEYQVVHWQQERQAAQQTLLEEQGRRPPLQESPQLRAQQVQAQQQLQRSQQVLNYLSREPLRASQSFSEPVLQLGEIPVRGVWLSRFWLSDSGQQIRLEGGLSSPDVLSSYVGALGQQSGFQRYAFRQIDVQRREDATLSFILDSQPAPVSGQVSGGAQ